MKILLLLSLFAAAALAAKAPNFVVIYIDDLGWAQTSVEMIEVNGDCRVFEMLGMGKITERILTNDAKEMKLQYSAVETRTPINHHLATMQIFKLDKNKCTLFWTTEIEPEIFADAIHKGMLISIDGIKKVILE